MIVTSRRQPALLYDQHNGLYNQQQLRESRRRKPLHRDRNRDSAQDHPRPESRQFSPSIYIDTTGFSITSYHPDQYENHFWNNVSKATGDHRIAQFASHGANFIFNSMVQGKEDWGRGNSCRRHEGRKAYHEESCKLSNLESDYDSDFDFDVQHINPRPYCTITNRRANKNDWLRESSSTPPRSFPNPHPQPVHRSPAYPRANYKEFLSYAGKENELPHDQRIVIEHWIKFTSIVEERILEIAQDIYPDDVLSCKIVPDGSRHCVAGLWKGNNGNAVFCETDLESSVACSSSWADPRDAMWELKGRVENMVQEGDRQKPWW